MTTRHSYGFPNGRVVFLVFVGPPVAFLAYMLWRLRYSMFPWPHFGEQTATIVGAALIAVVAIAFATTIANAFPDVNVRSDGIEIRFFFPLLTRWFFLPWKAIDHISRKESPLKMLNKKLRPDLLVYSRVLPVFYFVPMLWFASTLRRGFFIGRQIQKYDELAIALEAIQGRTAPIAAARG